MSVRGEFQRILGDTTATLRVEGQRELAERLEHTESHAGESLDARARAVLAEIEAVIPELRPTLDHLGAICHAIVGH